MPYTHLSRRERYDIERFRKQGLGPAAIARQIRRNTSTVSRELRRNATGTDTYDAEKATRSYEDRRHRANFGPQRRTIRLMRVVAPQLKYHTPEIIAGRARSADQDMLSHETIYLRVYAEKRNGSTPYKQLYKHLPQSHKKRRKRLNGRNRRGQIPERIGIEERPSIVEERRREGDYEIDTIIGKRGRNGLLTIVDRTTRRVWIRYLVNLEAATTTAAIIDALNGEILHTITSDNGKEFAGHREVNQALNAPYYFCDPYCSWQRGSNEQVNGLIRRTFPKGTDFSQVTEGEIQRLESALNNRPRKVLGFYTPDELYWGRVSLSVALQF